MKKIALYAIIFSTLSLGACGTEKVASQENAQPIESNNQNTEEVEAEVEAEVEVEEEKEEIELYIDEIREVSMQLGELSANWDKLRNASANGEIDDYSFVESIYYDIAPVSIAVSEEIEGIVPPTDKTVELHEILIEVVNTQHLAFTEIAAAIESGDVSKVTSGNELLNEVRKKEREYVRGMEALAEEYGISLN